MTEERRALLAFEALVELPPAEREVALARLAAEEPATHPIVVRMLAADATARHLFERPALGIDVVARARELPAAQLLPRQAGRFELLEVLGAGSSSVVYRAMQDRPRRPVALKVFLGLAASDQAVVRREAELQAQLHHPGIVHVYDQGVLPDGLPFVAMELVDGPSLMDWVATQQPDRRQRLAALIAIATTVRYLHEHGILHRDLKPEHIRIEDIQGSPHPRLLDFGVAQRLRDADEEGLELGGTPGYMSPEQRAGQRDLDARSDLFALGSLARELLAGSSGGDIDDGDLAAIVARCCAADRGQRYRTSAALLDDLQRLLTGRAVAARTNGRMRAGLRLLSSHPWRLLGGTLAVALVLLLNHFVGRAGTAEDRLANATRTASDLLCDLDPVAGTSSQRRIAAQQLLDDVEATLRGNPGDTRLQQRLAELHGRLGNLAMEQGDLPEAAQQRTAALLVWTKLRHDHAMDPEFAAAWATAQVQVGDVTKATSGPPAAGTAYAAAHAVFLDLAAANPRERRAVDDLAWSLARLAEVQLLQHDLPAAAESLRHRLELIDRLEQLAPQHPSTLAGKYEVHTQRAELARTLGDRTFFIKELEAASAAATAWLGATPHHVLAMVAQLRATTSLAGEARRQGDLAAAGALLAGGESVAQRLLELEPLHDRANEALAARCGEHAQLLAQRGESAAAYAIAADNVRALERWHAATGTRSGQSQRIVIASHRLAAKLATAADLGGHAAHHRTQARILAEVGAHAVSATAQDRQVWVETVAEDPAATETQRAETRQPQAR